MNILITGGSGLVGKTLTKQLQNTGNSVFWLSRNPENQPRKSFYWNIQKGEIDKNAFNNIDAIIHLAGASVASKRWTKEYKQEIVESRIKSTALLANFLNNNTHTVKHFMAASAIGIYGDRENEILTESSEYADTFLAQVCIKWENEVGLINNSIRKCIIRIGIVLNKDEGALAEMLKTIKWGLGAPLGTGKQYVSWIHLVDLRNIFLYLLENENLKGVYNAVAPNPVTNTELTTLIAKTIKKPCFLPPVPKMVLKLIIGEMVDMVLASQNVSSKKIIDTKYPFEFTNLQQALNDILVEK